VSNGTGRTTCSYFYPAGDQILYSSTHHHDATCPPNPDFSLGYVWAIYPTYDIFVAGADGSNLRQLTTEDGYDAEATFSPRGDRIVFTSVRDGDLDLYSMAPDGSDVRRLTDRPGYDGGAFYSPDGSQIIWRAHYPAEGPELDDYVSLLRQGLIRPGELEIMAMNADGSNQRQVTSIGGANFAPYWHPSGDKVVFSSNHHDPSGRDFDIYMVNLDGTGLTRITESPGFDGFPVFSPDGRYLVFASNRNNGGTNDTNVFIAEWVE
jgi:Tol biopolymer transport system component